MKTLDHEKVASRPRSWCCSSLLYRDFYNGGIAFIVRIQISKDPCLESLGR